jgi:drug/metabolite transporter (DMT)-like permease
MDAHKSGVNRVQMFIGEMGCWLFVAGHAMYRRYILKESRAASISGYQPVNGTDEIEDPDTDAGVPRRRLSSQEAAPPAMKALFPNHDNRMPLGNWKVMMLALPASCDIVGTTLMNAGFLFVAASIYQMTRGALVLFVGLFSVMFLKRKLYLYQWLALLLAVIGVGIVGLAGVIYGDSEAAPDASPAAPSKSHADLALIFIRAAGDQVSATARSPEAIQTIVGVFLIAGAQVFTAAQFVLEEWILENYALEPLKVVGWEGVFGFIVTVFGMLVLHLSIGRTERGRNGYFDAAEGWREISQYRSIGVSSFLIMVSIG